MKKFLLILLICLLIYAAALSYTYFPQAGETVNSPEIPANTNTPEPDPTPAPEADTPLPTPSPAPSPTPTPTPTPSSTPTPTAMPIPTPEPTDPPAYGSYYITVNVQANTVTVYTLDDEGYYSIPYKAMVCSTGPATPTSGVYGLGEQHRWHYLFGDVYGQYTTQITGNILFHSVPYTVYGDPSSLEYWEFDKLGTSSSMGCIRLQVKDAKWIYDNYSSIVAVQFYNDEDPGPLGKPSAPLISDNESCRGWDPTDQDPNNPWLNPPAESTSDPEPSAPVTPSEPSPEPTEDENIIIIG